MTAFIERWSGDGLQIDAHAYEIDEALLERLVQRAEVLGGPNVRVEVFLATF